MKKIAMLLTALVMVLLLTVPTMAMAKAADKWICSKCMVWVNGEYCPQCYKPRPADATDNECLLTIQIDYQKNIIFAKYDVDVLINGKKMFTIAHGTHTEATLIVPKGVCEVVLRHSGNNMLDRRVMLNTSRDAASFSAKLVSHVLYLTLSDMTGSYITSYALSEGESAIIDGVNMKVVDVKESRGSSTNKPADGYVFVFVEFEVANTHSLAVRFSENAHFRCYLDGYSIQPSERAAAAAPMDFSGVLRSGEKMKAMLCFEVPTNWRNLQIIYSNMDDQLCFSVGR